MQSYILQGDVLDNAIYRPYGSGSCATIQICSFIVVKLDWSTLAAKDAVPGALSFMVADRSTDDAHGIVLKKPLSRFHHLVVFEGLYDFRNGGVDGAVLDTHGDLAVQTPSGVHFNLQRHDYPLFPYFLWGTGSFFLKEKGTEKELHSPWDAADVSTAYCDENGEMPGGTSSRHFLMLCN